jgi:hypothetical protein
MFATRLGQWLGLPMPRVEVIEVSDWLITNTSDMRIDVGGLARPCSSGQQLASLYPETDSQVLDYLPEGLLTKITNLQDYPRCLVLDKWTGNCDGRQAVFTRRPRGRRYKSTFIESGKRASLLALSPLRTGRESFPSSGSSRS